MTFKTLLLATALGCSSATAAAQTAPARPPSTARVGAERAFNIPAGGLSEGLRLFGQQSGVQTLFDARLTDSRRTSGVRGRMSAEAALGRLLEGTGLRTERTDRGVWIIRPDDAVGGYGAAAVQVEDVVVTGSLIRGADGPSPVTVVTRDEIDRRGYGSVGQALQALPQNFGGNANEGALQNGADTSGTNVSFATGVNLRGLGSDATLVLVNGRRLGGSGAKADFADVSTIPTAAVDRVEVLLDGASALYGSDAVGGVVNIILKTDFDGAETRLRAGSVTDGPSGEWSVAQLVGKSWTGGGALVSYEYADREALPVADRDRAGDADLRGYGGSDRRLTYSHPGNIVQYDAALGAYVPRFAIPRGQDGSDLQPVDFLAGQVNLQNQRAGMNVYGRQTRHSLFAAVHQDLGERLTLSADARLGRRAWDTVSLASATVLTVDTRNPWFVSPTGATSHQIGYSFLDDIGAARVFGDVESLGATLAAELRLTERWRLDGYLAWAREISDGRFTNQLNTANLREALGTAADSPLTPFSAARDGYFNPFGDGSVNTDAVVAFISAGSTQSVQESEVFSAHLQLTGDLVELPAGPLRVALGLDARKEEQAESGYTWTSSILPNPVGPRGAGREVQSAFLEVRAPLFGPDNRRPGLERLELSAAVRHERYDDIGETTNPKLGILWSPVNGLNARASWGTSFRAPALVEMNEAPVNSPSLLPRGAVSVVSMIQYGGNRDLEPETAESWTAGFDFRPSSLAGLRLSATWFDTRFDQRIGRPVLDNILGALSDPALTSFIRFISPNTSADDRAAIQAILDQPITASSGLFPVTSYGAIVDARYVNTTALEVAGLDLEARYGFRTGEDHWVLTGSVSHLSRYDVQATPTSAPVRQLDRPNHPISLRGRASLDWSRDVWGAGVTLNHQGGYADLTGRPIEAWTTADLQFRWEPEGAPWRASLSVNNALDADPPFYDAPQGIAYDAANANVLGRFVAVQVVRSW